MTLPVVWLPEAYEELKQRLAHYDAIRLELGTRFLLGVDETLDAISTQPLALRSSIKTGDAQACGNFPMGFSLWWRKPASL